MVGLEKAEIPGLARGVFGIDANTAVLSFVAAFGISKAISNYSVAKLTKKYNRKTILITGWLFAVPGAAFINVCTQLELDFSCKHTVGY